MESFKEQTVFLCRKCLGNYSVTTPQSILFCGYQCKYNWEHPQGLTRSEKQQHNPSEETGKLRRQAATDAVCAKKILDELKAKKFKFYCWIPECSEKITMMGKNYVDKKLCDKCEDIAQRLGKYHRVLQLVDDYNNNPNKYLRPPDFLKDQIDKNLIWENSYIKFYIKYSDSGESHNYDTNIFPLLRIFTNDDIVIDASGKSYIDYHDKRLEYYHFAYNAYNEPSLKIYSVTIIQKIKL
uniref:Uncharacterized protein n=1 Tax=Marseillevirus LCMAC201 TaxID=2506605 RepID=A0A481YWR0_9VIRU|nr:MAG: hypothetical protein LCMAC201_01270 [Marseillevirus LCMAC201]